MFSTSESAAVAYLRVALDMAERGQWAAVGENAKAAAQFAHVADVHRRVAT